MDLSTLKTAPGARKKRNRVGRGPGSGNGKTCGRGHKGQKSRSGYSRKAGFEGGQMPINRRLPKRGFYHEDRFPCFIVNLDVLEQKWEAGVDVTPETLVKAGLAEPMKGGVKILGRGELTKKLTVRCNAISEGARGKIESAGGTVELIQLSAPVGETAAV
jgi:large subunit ribosomal protein L15